MSAFELSPEEEDTLKEITNIGFGKAVSILGDMLDRKIEIGVPKISVMNLDDVGKVSDLPINQTVSAVKLGFNGIFSGESAILFAHEDAIKLVNVLTEDWDEDFDDLKAETLNEVGNIVLNSVMGAIANILSVKLDFSVPSYLPDTVENIFKVSNDDPVLAVATKFFVDDEAINGSVLVTLNLNSYRELTQTLDVLYAS